MAIVQIAHCWDEPDAFIGPAGRGKSVPELGDVCYCLHVQSSSEAVGGAQLAISSPIASGSW